MEESNEQTMEQIQALVLRAVGRKGGLQRARNMSPAERSESARKAAQARWNNA